MGSGKSYWLCWLAQALAREHPGIEILMGRAHSPMMKLTIMRDFERLCPPAWLADIRRVDRQFIFQNGSIVSFRPLSDWEELKGLTIGAALVDEWTEVPEQSTEVLRDRLRQPGMPGLLAGATNPKGPSHYLYKQFVEPTERKRTGRGWFSGSSLENTSTPQAYRDSLLLNHAGKDLDQRVLGAWVDPDTIVWDTFDRSRCTGPAPRLDGPEWTVDLSIDFGFEHWFCALWGARQVVRLPGQKPFERCLVYRQYWGRKRQLEEHARAITTHIAEDAALGIRPPAKVFADSAAAQDRHELRTMSDPALRIPSVGASKSFVNGIRSVRGAFLPTADGWPRLILCAEQSRFSPKDAPDLADQVESYQRPENETREDVVLSHSSKGESIDDGCDALRYLWYSRAQDTFERQVGYDPGMDEMSRRRFYVGG